VREWLCGAAPTQPACVPCCRPCDMATSWSTTLLQPCGLAVCDDGRHAVFVCGGGLEKWRRKLLGKYRHNERFQPLWGYLYQLHTYACICVVSVLLPSAAVHVTFSPLCPPSLVSSATHTHIHVCLSRVCSLGCGGHTQQDTIELDFYVLDCIPFACLFSIGVFSSLVPSIFLELEYFFALLVQFGFSTTTSKSI